MKIIGLRIEKYIDKAVSGHNCDFTYSDAEFEKHIICGVLEDNRKVEIELSASEGECGSGWCAASFGHVSVKEVKKFAGYSFVPKANLVIDDILPNVDCDIENDVFSISSDGGDNYYPSGSYSVNMELFKETVRAKKKRPIWIFKGQSNSGKSFLAAKIKGLEVLETDGFEELPSSIVASIIVLGNKYPHTIEDIKLRIFGDAEISVVDFSLIA